MTGNRKGVLPPRRPRRIDRGRRRQGAPRMPTHCLRHDHRCRSVCPPWHRTPIPVHAQANLVTGIQAFNVTWAVGIGTLGIPILYTALAIERRLRR